jgi:hypothetical protein
VAQERKLRAKTPKYPPSARPIRRFVLEVLFFGALAVFGFSMVFSWLGNTSEQGAVVAFQPNIELPNIGPAQPAQAAALYEAPSQRPPVEFTLSPIFTASVQYWKDDLIRWSSEHNLDPNLSATVMQIESCGNPNAGSGAGAMGLFPGDAFPL